MPEWSILAIEEYLFVKKTSSFVVIGTARSLFDSLWVQLNRFSFFTSWPHQLENQKSYIIKIGAELIIQVSLVLSERRLHEGLNHLCCDDKISGFRNWLIEVWMLTGTGRVTIWRFPSDIQKQKQVLQDFFIFCALQIKWLAGNDIPFSSSKTTCSISAKLWRV